MADEVTVEMRVPELASELQETRRSMSEIVEKIDKSADAQNKAAEAQAKAADAQLDAAGKELEAARSLEDVGGHLYSDGSTSGLNADLLGDLVSDEGGESTSLLRKIGGSLSQHDGRIGQIGSAITDIDGRLNGFGRTLQMVTGALGEGGFAGALGSAEGALGGLGGAVGAAGAGLEGLAAAAGPVGAALAAIPIVIGALEEGIDVYQSMRDVAISQTGSDERILLGAEEWLDARYQSTLSGLSEDEAIRIQQGLISGRAAFGSAEYNEGQRFSTNARLNYGLEADKATDLYVKAVMRGSTTVNELNTALESLQKTAQESDTTMSQMLDSFTKAADTLEKKYGSAGVDMAVDLAKAGLTDAEFDSIGGLINQASSQDGYGSYFTQMVNRYGEEYEAGPAAALASLDMLTKGMVGGRDAQMLLGMNVAGEGYKTIGEYLSEALASGGDIDWDEFEEAIRAIEEGPQGNWLQFQSYMQKLGVTPDEGEQNAAGYRKLFEGLFKKSFESQGVGLAGEAGVRDIKDRMAAYDISEYGVIDGWSAGAITMNMAREQAAVDEMVSAAFNEGSYTKDAMDNAMVGLLQRGVISAEDFENLSDKARYKLLKSAAEDYRASGETDWEQYVIHNQAELTSAFSDYTSQFKDVKSSREADKLAAEITVKFEGDLGEYLSGTVHNTWWRQAQDNAND